MILSGLSYDNSHIVIYMNTRLLQNIFCALAHERRHRTLSILLNHQFDNPVDNLRVFYLISPVFLHVENQIICRRVHYNDFFLCDTGQIVIETAAIDNIFSCFLNVSSLIHHYGRITCACTDSLFTAGKYSFYNTRTTRCHQHPHHGMAHHGICILNGSL